MHRIDKIFISPRQSSLTYVPSYTRIPFLDTRTELVETQRKIIIYRNGISIIGFPLLCMYQSSESLPKLLSNLPTVSRKIPKKIFS